MTNRKYAGRDNHLKRLPPEFYRGQAYVHWTMTMQGRQTGWLTPALYDKFREILANTAFRHALAVPIYCCMPDHIHMLVLGMHRDSDQLLATRYFRKHMNRIFEGLGYCLQREAYDHVLKDEERASTAFEEIAEYIARNPERAKLVNPDAFRTYPFTGCLIPAFPELHCWDRDYWERCWRTIAYLRDRMTPLRTADSGEE
jgi:REP element-mobilizing transposase RayT